MVGMSAAINGTFQTGDLAVDLYLTTVTSHGAIEYDRRAHFLFV
jgi:hypothetical protein